MQRIVVGIDGSDNGRAALDWAVAEAALRGAVLEVVHAWQVPYFADPYAMAPLDPTVWQRDAASRLAAAVDEIDVGDLAAPVERTLVQSSAPQALLEAAEAADLLVVGARGHGGFTGLLLGSVSHQVVNHARCPVVVVHAPTERTGRGTDHPRG